MGLLNDKSREHVGVAKPKSAFDPNAAQVGHFDLLLLGHSSFVVSVQFLPVFISQEYPNRANPKLVKQHPRFVLGVHLPLYNK